MIRVYFHIVRKSVQDMVPKAVMKFLVIYIREHLSTHLGSTVSNAEDIEDIVVESTEVIEIRKAATEKLEELKKAKHIIDETLRIRN